MRTDLFVLLAQKYLDNSATQDEREVVEQYWEILSGMPVGELSAAELKRVEESIRQTVFDTINHNTQEDTDPKVIPIRRRPWLRYAAAAAVIAIMVIAGKQLFQEKPVITQTQAQRFHNDILPAKAGATLQLANGTIINLDTAANGQLVAGIKKDGQSLTVEGSEATTTYATLSTSKGVSRSIILPDGSIAWLDAQSSITFPNRFTGKTREISITGRVFIEAFHDAAHPLITHTKDKDVTVWGTQFNIDAYGPVTTTLVEGKVQVGESMLKPGEQYKQGRISEVENMDRIVAWKENNFKFEYTPIREVTEELSRWYDMEIVFHDNIEGEYRFTITRNVPLSEILKAMEQNGLVKFTIEGKQVTVYKAK